MQGIEIIDETVLVQNGNTVLADENKLWMGNVEFVAVRCANGEWSKPAGQPLLQFVDIHDGNVCLQQMGVKKTCLFCSDRHDEGKAIRNASQYADAAVALLPN
jgi:hypothetical protein